MVSWPLTTGWTVVMIVLVLPQLPSSRGVAGLTGLLLAAFLVTWGLQTLGGWVYRKWVSFWTKGGIDEDADAPEPAD